MPTDLGVPARLGNWHLAWRNAPRVAFGAIRDAVIAAEEAGAVAFIVGTEGGGFEPLTLLSALASVTSRIGLVAGIDPLVVPPYTAARRLAALDHASNGRAGWRLAPTLDDAQRREYVQVVHALWDSWTPDAHRCDKAAGVYIDTSGVRSIDHKGQHYDVAGPLDLPRPPQGHLPLYAIGDDAAVGINADVQAGADEHASFGAFSAWFAWVRYLDVTHVHTSQATSDAIVQLPSNVEVAKWPELITAVARHARAMSSERKTLRARLALAVPESPRTREAT